MKKTIVLLLTLLNVACSDNANLELQGIANEFSVLESPAYGGAEVIENSYVYLGDKLMTIYDLGAKGDMTVATVGASLTGANSPVQVLPNNARFSYIINHDGVYKNFVTRSSKVHLMSSNDLYNWTEEGIVLDNVADSTSTRHQQWNAAVTYDSTGRAYMLVESGSGAANQGDVRLTHLEAPVGSNSFSEVGVGPILGGGNAWVQHIEGKGLLAVYGSTVGGYWNIRAAILPDGNTQWQEAPVGAFNMFAGRVHVADPHLIETKDGHLLMSISFDQVITITLKSQAALTYSGLYDKILNSL